MAVFDAVFGGFFGTLDFYKKRLQNLSKCFDFYLQEMTGKIVISLNMDNYFDNVIRRWDENDKLYDLSWHFFSGLKCKK